MKVVATKEKSIGESSNAGMRESKPLTGATIGSVTAQQKLSNSDSSSEKKSIRTLIRRSQVIAVRKSVTERDRIKNSSSKKIVLRLY